MKKVFLPFLLLFVFALAFTSCKKDKDDASIVGKWGLYENYYKVTTRSGTNDETTPVTSNSVEYSVLEFTSDGKVSMEWPIENYKEDGNYRIEGNKLFIKLTGLFDESEHEFSVTGAELHITTKDQGQGWNDEETNKYKRL